MKRLTALAMASLLPLGAAWAQDGLPRAPVSRDRTPADPLRFQSVRHVEPAAVAAMIAMGESMRDLEQFEVTAQTAAESVLERGLKVTLRGELVVKAHRPHRFAMELRTDHGGRRYVYDGSTLAIYTPGARTFLQIAESGTVEEILTLAYEKYGLELPLKEIFLWSEIGRDTDELEIAIHVGASRVGGRECDHYVYRGPERDWQIWMTRGERRLPCKVSVTERFKEGMPEFFVDLEWRTDVTLPPETFVFTPPPYAKPVVIAQLRED